MRCWPTIITAMTPAARLDDDDNARRQQAEAKSEQCVACDHASLRTVVVAPGRPPAGGSRYANP